MRSVPTDEARAFAERHSLSFIETSALDCTNVETAFHNILTGKLTNLSSLCSLKSNLTEHSTCIEIYRIVSQRPIDTEPDKDTPPGGPGTIVVAPTESSMGSKSNCCKA